MSRWTPDRRTDAQSDAHLAALARAGDQDAFAEIVARYHGPLLGMARRLCSDGRAEDVVQQTFLGALVAFRAGTEVRHLRGWLHQILRHAAQRAPSPLEIALDPDREAGAATVEDHVERRLATHQVLAAMAALPSRQRDAMVATAIDGQSRSAVADAMGLSEGAVRQLMHRARQTLRAAAYAATPWPVQRWLTRSPRGGGGNPGSAVAAVVASPLSGTAAKLAAVVASGALAAGYLGPSGAGQSHHRSTVRITHQSVPIDAQPAVVIAGSHALLTDAFVSAQTIRAVIGSRPDRSSGFDGDRGPHAEGDNRPGGPGSPGGPGAGSDRGRSGDSGSGSSDGSGGSNGGPSAASTRGDVSGGNGGSGGGSGSGRGTSGGGSGGGSGSGRGTSDGGSGSGHGTSDGGSGSGASTAEALPAPSASGPANTPAATTASSSPGSDGGGGGSGSGGGSGTSTGVSAPSSSSGESSGPVTVTNSKGGRDLFPASDSSVP
jgi:RNA polymerase sigma factor (sigma-70 family)